MLFIINIFRLLDIRLKSTETNMLFFICKCKNRAGQAFKVTKAYLCRHVFLVSLTSRWKMSPADERCIHHLRFQTIKLYWPLYCGWYDTYLSALKQPPNHWVWFVRCILRRYVEFKRVILNYSCFPYSIYSRGAICKLRGK